MILSASRRTDIPCYYSEWFINRLKAGYALSRNPMNHAQLSKISLSPDVVDCIVFWTKDALNFMPHLTTIDDMGYKYYFQFTLTPYDSTIEKNLCDKADIENTFIKLSQTIGKERVLWRYDPIVVNDTLAVEYHKEQFARLCDKLHPYTESVTISFVDTYAKLKTNLIREITDDEIAELSAYIGQTAKNYGLTAKACCEKTDLTVYGIERASCIDKAVIMANKNKLSHMHIHNALGKKNHLALGTGELDLPKYFYLANKHNCRVVLETKTIDGLKQSVEWVKNRV